MRLSFSRASICAASKTLQSGAFSMTLGFTLVSEEYRKTPKKPAITSKIMLLLFTIV
jgi:hypothetical protein